ncbi:MAG: phospholipase D [Parcubacteria group bacterium Gr01-1014_3]|nr:MAG: phospholipase D [Parcubacteria group bacterium Gr01-1014_3]
MLETIHQAKRSIYLESFILSDDDRTHYFFEALRKKAAEGVRVKIVIDRVGSFFFGSIDKDKFEKVGAEILFFRRWFYRTHRKVLIVDDEVAFLGGVNIRGEYANWLDLHMRLDGLLVRQLLKSFAKIYALAGGKEQLVSNRKKGQPSKARSVLYRAKTWLIERWPIRGKSALKDYYKKQCFGAQQSIVIVTPYFLPHQWLLKSLKSAAKRGVKIEVLIPRKTDISFFNVFHKIIAYSLKDYIRVLFIPEMNHAKVLLVDDKEGLIGSNNIDARSFDYNLEASVIFQRKDMVGDLKKILETWKKTALPIEAIEKDYRLTITRVILRWIAKILQPIL